MKCHLIKISVTIILLGLVAVGGFLYKKSFIDITVQDKFFNKNRGKLSGRITSEKLRTFSERGLEKSLFL